MDKLLSDHEIALKACAFDRACFSDGNEPSPDTLVQHHQKMKADPKFLTRLQPRNMAVQGFYEGYRQAMVESSTNDTARWVKVQTELDREREAHRRTELELATTKKNIGIVIKPPPPPPPAAPSDPWCWIGEAHGFDCRVSRTGDVEYLNHENRWAPCGMDRVLVGARRSAIRSAIVALHGRIDAYEEMLATVRESSLDSIDKMHAADSPVPTVDELLVEHLARLSFCAFDRANGNNGDWDKRSSHFKECERAGIRAVLADLVKTPIIAANIERSDDRRWVRLHALRNGAAFETPNGIRAVKSAYVDFNGRIDCVLLSNGLPAGFGGTQEQHNDVVVREIVVPERQAPPEKVDRDVSPAPTPLVFHDNDERTFWDSMTLVLARKNDATSQSVASAADELVEERRARQPNGVVSEMRRADVEDPKPTEPSDELLLKAACWANQKHNQKTGPIEHEIRCAIDALKSESSGDWGDSVRTYVAMAIDFGK